MLPKMNMFIYCYISIIITPSNNVPEQNLKKNVFASLLYDIYPFFIDFVFFYNYTRISHTYYNYSGLYFIIIPYIILSIYNYVYYNC